MAEYSFDRFPDRSEEKEVSAAPGSVDDGTAGMHRGAYFQLSDAVYYADYVLRVVLCGHGRTGITRKID